MKNLIVAFILVVASNAAFANFGSLSMAGDKVSLNTQASTLSWKASKVTGSHKGTVSISSGELIFENNVLTGGSFVIDMTSINVTDLQGGGKEKLEGHLKSADFFNTEEVPTASFVITKVVPKGTPNDYKIIGNMTIKGITKEVKFYANVASGVATASIILDRTDYDVRYGSGTFFGNLGDNTIYDEFDLAIRLVY